VNRARLLDRLRAAGRDAAGLVVPADGGDALAEAVVTAPEGSFLLHRQDDRWAVATVDRGERFPHRVFDSESEACEHLLGVLTADRERATVSAAELDEATRYATALAGDLRDRLERAPAPMFRMLAPGEIVERTGGDGGHYLFPVGTPLEQRGLPPAALDQGGSRLFRICEPFSVVVTLVTPAGGRRGGAVMYRTSHLADDLATLFDGEFVVELTVEPTAGPAGGA
jgi:hypothetical protein